MRLFGIPRRFRSIAGRALLLLATLGVSATLGVGDALAHDALHVQIDSTKVIRLKDKASTVIIGNSNIAEVSVESPTLVFVSGLRPGETSLDIMDEDGKAIYTTVVVVTPTNDRTVTVDRNTFEFTFSCDPRCAQTRTPGEDAIKPAKSAQSTAVAPPPETPAAAAAGGESSQLLLQPTTGGE